MGVEKSSQQEFKRCYCTICIFYCPSQKCTFFRPSQQWLLFSSLAECYIKSRVGLPLVATTAILVWLFISAYLGTICWLSLNWTMTFGPSQIIKETVYPLCQSEWSCSISARNPNSFCTIQTRRWSQVGTCNCSGMVYIQWLDLTNVLSKLPALHWAGRVAEVGMLMDSPAGSWASMHTIIADQTACIIVIILPYL